MREILKCSIVQWQEKGFGRQSKTCSLTDAPSSISGSQVGLAGAKCGEACLLPTIRRKGAAAPTPEELGQILVADRSAVPNLLQSLPFAFSLGLDMAKLWHFVGQTTSRLLGNPQLQGVLAALRKLGSTKSLPRHTGSERSL